MENVYRLKCPKNDILLTLEELLELTNSDMIDSIAFAGVLKNNHVISGAIVEKHNEYTLLGVIERAKLDVLLKLLED